MDRITYVLECQKAFTPKKVVDLSRRVEPDLEAIRMEGFSLGPAKMKNPRFDRILTSEKWRDFAVWDPVETGAYITFSRVQGRTQTPFFVRVTFDQEAGLIRRTDDAVPAIHKLAEVLMAKVPVKLGASVVEIER
jgi:hypothetical protein